MNLRWAMADDAKSDEIEITLQMIEAGVAEFWGRDIDEVGSEDVVKRVFAAMSLAKQADYIGDGTRERRE